ncbi:MAG TPA: PKD domain-containing protein, partial [Flavisolibacter sp.]
VQKPIITIAGLPQSGCRPLTIQPVATVTSAQGISTYTWYFGDGTTGTGTSPVHTYTTLGSFDVMLVVTTTGGCSDTLLIPDAVKTGDKPQANFSVNPVNVCAFQNVQFNDLTTGTPDAWYWQFGDGGTSSDQNPLYQYSDTGWFTVTLFTWSNNCPDTFTIVNAIYVKPPIANFTVAPGCVNKFKKDFTDQSVGAETWFWNFGDGTSSTQQHPSHTYTNPGTYTVSLTVTNDSCSHTRDMTVYVVDETVDFTISSPVVCKNVPVQFASTGMNAANISSWSWDFGDGSVASAHPVSHAYSAAGTYQVTLTATDLNGCVGTKTRPVTVYGPTAQFSVQTPVTCHGNADIFFNDASATDGSHPIVQWTWNYGDGVIDSNASLPYHHVYGSPGVYPVLLTVKDSYGCTDALTIPAAVTVTKPLAQFTVADTAFCTNTTVQFNNTSSGNNLQFNWNFGDGTTSTVASPAHSYTSAGIYTVTLIATDASGCKDTMVRTSFIHIVPPLASFTMSDTASTCPPLMVDFVNTSVNYSSVHWDFGDSTSSTLANPSHFYTMPGVYVVKLTITGVSGCTDVFMRTININGPSGTFTYTPLSGCNPLTVTFTANSWNRSYFVWDFSDGVTITTTDSVVTHTYTTPGTYLPKMILVNDAGCAVPVLGNDPIEVYGADAHFGIQNYPFCDSASVSFSDSTFMNDAITSYLWNFGDGTTSTSQNPVHLYTTPGSYTISLAVTTVSGCMDTATMVNAVNIYESPVIDIIGDTTACVPASLAYSGVVIRGDSLSWNWNLSTSTSAAQVPPVQNYIIPGTYYVSAIATNQHGCSDTVIRRVQVNPVPVVNAGPDAVSCLGTPVQLAASGATQYSWNASPDLSCTGCSTTSALPQQSTTYVVTGTNTFGCKASDSVHVRVRMPFVLQEPLNDSICTGSSARLTAGGAEVYSWSPAATLDNASSATPRATPTMTTTYTVIAADSDGCFSDTATATIYVWPIPVVDAGYDQNIEVGTSVQLASTSSSDVTSWKWMPSLGLSCSTCPNPVAQPQKTTEYKLQVKNPAGCQAEDQMRIIVTCGKGNLFLPNTFSPNGDGSNDRFYPRGSGIARIKSLRVFNRWGEVVFERLNFDVNQAGAGWDGMYKGKPASPDVYVFTCEVVCLNNEVLEYKGDISLLR